MPHRGQWDHSGASGVLHELQLRDPLRAVAVVGAGPGWPSSDSLSEPNIAAFRQGLRDRGFVEGQTAAVEYRYAQGRADRYAGLAAELVRLKVDVIVVGSGLATLAVRDATRTIPIVFVGGGDPVERGLDARWTGATTRRAS